MPERWVARDSNGASWLSGTYVHQGPQVIGLLADKYTEHCRMFSVEEALGELDSPVCPQQYQGKATSPKTQRGLRIQKPRTAKEAGQDM